MSDPTFIRASGQCLCSICGLEYWKHPLAEKWLGYHGKPFLRVLCSGQLVKL